MQRLEKERKERKKGKGGEGGKQRNDPGGNTEGKGYHLHRVGTCGL